MPYANLVATLLFVADKPPCRGFNLDRRPARPTSASQRSLDPTFLRVEVRDQDQVRAQALSEHLNAIRHSGRRGAT